MLAFLHHSFTRFLLVGVANTIVGLSSIYLLLHGAGLSYWLGDALTAALPAGWAENLAVLVGSGCIRCCIRC